MILSLITRRSLVQIQPPQPENPRKIGFFGDYYFALKKKNKASYPYCTLTRFRFVSMKLSFSAFLLTFVSDRLGHYIQNSLKSVK